MRPVIFTFLCGLATLSMSGLASPAMLIPQRQHDFGEIYRGQTVTQRFNFRNAGSSPLVIYGVHATCGCTAAEIEPGREYQPGEEGFIDVSFDATHFSGPINKTVTVITNEGRQSTKVLTLRAAVIEELVTSPPVVDFGTVTVGDTPQRIVKVKQKGATKTEVLDVQGNDEVLTTSFYRTDDDSNEWVVRIGLKPDQKARFVKETLLIKTSSAYLSDLPVMVRAQVVGPIAVSSDYIEFGAVSQADNARRHIELVSDSDFAITNARIELLVNGKKFDQVDEILVLNGKFNEHANEQSLTLDLSNQPKLAGSVHGRVVLETTNLKQKEVAIDFYALFM